MHPSIVETHRGEGIPEGFAELPQKIYASDARWIPEDPSSVVRSFSGDNPYFAAADAIALSVPGKARLAGFFNPTAKIGGKQCAYFGYLETTADREAEQALFERVESWAKQRGAQALFGPIEFSTHGRYRLVMDMEENAQPFPGEPYNPTYYPARLEELGYSVHTQYMTQTADKEVTRALVEADAERLCSMQAKGYRFEPLDAKLWEQMLPQIHQLSESIFRDAVGYTPIPWPLFERHFGAAFVERLCPYSSILCFGPKDDLAGVSVNYPNWGPLVRSGNGESRLQLTSLNFEKHFPLLRSLGPTELVVKTVAVTPSHQGLGLFKPLTSAGLARGLPHYDVFHGALIRSKNESASFFGRAKHVARHYGLYARPLK